MSSKVLEGILDGFSIYALGRALYQIGVIWPIVCAVALAVFIWPQGRAALGRYVAIIWPTLKDNLTAWADRNPPMLRTRTGLNALGLKITAMAAILLLALRIDPGALRVSKASRRAQC